MKKGFILLGLTLSITLTGCSQQAPKTQALELSNFKNAEGSYEFTEIPTDSTVEEVEKLLGVSLEQPSFTTEQGTESYTIKDLYHYNEEPIMLRLDFEEGQLESTMFSISAEESTAEALFSDVADSLVELYGEETNTTENSGKLEELNNMTLDTKVMRWDTANDVEKTSLQLMMMGNNSTKSTILIGVVSLEETL